MRIMVVGLNYRTAPIELRERLVLSQDSAKALRSDISKSFENIESVFLSTCNRTELYLAYPSASTPDVEKINKILARYSHVSQKELSTVITRHDQQDAVEHLFRVAAGLDSMVIGEPEILGQVKRAYENAVNAGNVGSALHHIFQKALATARHVRRETGIGQGSLSVASVAVDMAKQLFSSFSDKTILSIGAGKMTKTMLGYLADLEPANLWLVNRTLPSAHELWDRIAKDNSAATNNRHWGVRKFEDINQLLIESDIVLTSTSSNQPIITAQSFKKISKQRAGKPIFFIDIAVPRDVDSKVGDFDNVSLHNIDDLQKVVARNAAERSGEIEQCQNHLKQSVEAALRHISHQEVGHIARMLRTKLHELGSEETQRTARKLAALGNTDKSALDENAQDVIEEHTRRLINKILHLPLSRLDERSSSKSLDFYSNVLNELFDLEKNNADKA